MRQTSLEAYDELITSGKLAVMERFVYETMKYCFEELPVTAKQIMDYYNITDPNHVRPRLTGLLKKGKVKIVGRKKKEFLWRVV